MDEETRHEEEELNEGVLEFSTLTEYEELMRQTTHLDAKIFAGHLVDTLIDEIALEGLDGITVQALKLRLEHRPNFSLEGFEDVATAIWDQIKYSKSLRFYVIPKERQDLVQYCWSDYRDDRGNPFEPALAPEEIYPYYPVEDKERGIRGSCMHYQSRKEVTGVVRRVPYVESIRLFGNRLVLVATQMVREKALFGTNYKKYHGLSISQYCMMERVGRARYSGEITRGKISFTCMNIQPKTLFYLRKTLLSLGLLTRQSASMKFNNCRCPAIITVFHLPRFYKRIETIGNLNMRTIFAHLNETTTGSIPVEYVVSKFGKHMLRNITNQFSEVVETAWEIVDDDLTSNHSKGKKAKRKVIRVLRLKITDIEKQELIIRRIFDGQSKSTDEGEGADGGEQEECQTVSCKTASNYTHIKILRPSLYYATTNESCHFFRTVIRAGTKGVIQQDMTFLQLTPLESRSSVRMLSRFKLCKEGVVKNYKQKAYTYTFIKFASKELEIKYALQEPTRKVLLELDALVLKLAEKQAVRDANRRHQAALQEDVNTTNDQEVTPKKGKPKLGALVESRRPEKTPKKLLVRADNTKVGPDASEENPEEIFMDTSSWDAEIMWSSSLELSPTQTKSIEYELPSPSVVKLQLVGDKLPKTPPRRTSTPILTANISPERIESQDELTSHFVTIINTKDLESQSDDNIENESIITLEGSKVGDIFGSSMESESESDIGLNDSFGEVQEEIDLEDLELESMNMVDRFKKFDAIDDEIRRKMTRQRVDWNSHDDRFILLAFIASALYIHKYNFLKVFIYNSTQIRDLLLLKTDGKATKTSLAIRRRLHFLMNQKAYYDGYIGLMGAALRDEVLYELYVKDFLRPPQARVYYHAPIEALQGAVNYLYTKFDSPEYAVIDTKGSLNGIETLLFIRQISRLEFFWNAIRFIIFCPMGKGSKHRRRFRQFWSKCLLEGDSKSPEKDNLVGGSVSGNSSISESEDDIKYSPDQIHYLQDSSDESSSDSSFDDYEYDSSTEKEVEIDCSGDELVKDEDGRDLKRNEELEMEYCFKFFKFIVRQCTIMFGSMMILRTAHKNSFALVSFDLSSTPSNICLGDRECIKDFEIQLWTARSVILDLCFTGDFTKSNEKSIIRHFDKPIERATKSLRRARILVCNKNTRLYGISKLMLKQFCTGLSSTSYDETLDFLKYIEEVPIVDSTACISSGIIHGIVELTDYFKSSITVRESLFTLNDEWVPIYDDLVENSPTKSSSSKKRKVHDASSDTMDNNTSLYKRCKLTEEEEEEIEDLIECFEDIEKDISVPKPRSYNSESENNEQYSSNSSTNALRLLRIRLNEAGVQMPRKHFTGFVERDFFTINLPHLEFKLPKKQGLNHRLSGASHPFSHDFMKQLKSSLVELVYHHVCDPKFEVNLQNISRFLGKYTVLFELINCAGNLGISGDMLLQKFERKSLVKGIRFLVDAKLVFTVGITHRRFVTFNNLQKWLIPICHQLGFKTVGNVVARTWISSLGSLNWSIINRLFIAILGQLQRPSVPFGDLCETLKPTLSVVEVIVLIEILVKLKYLTVYKLSEEEPSVFTEHPRDTSEIDYQVDTLVDTEGIYVAVSPYTTFLHAQLQEAVLEAAKGRRTKKLSFD